MDSLPVHTHRRGHRCACGACTATGIRRRAAFGESKPALLLGICTEVLVWAGLGALSACALICAYCARMAIGDVALVMLASCRAPLAMCSGTFVGAIAMEMTARQSQLFLLFKRR